MNSINPYVDIFVGAGAKPISGLNTKTALKPDEPAVSGESIAAQVAIGKQSNMSKDQAHKAAQDFESVFLAQMLNSYNPQNKDENSLLGKQEGDEAFHKMMMDEYAKEISKSGGIGIASYIEQELLGTRGSITKPVDYNLPLGKKTAAYDKAVNEAKSIEDEATESTNQGSTL